MRAGTLKTLMCLSGLAVVVAAGCRKPEEPPAAPPAPASSKPAAPKPAAPSTSSGKVKKPEAPQAAPAPKPAAALAADKAALPAPTVAAAASVKPAPAADSPKRAPRKVEVKGEPGKFQLLVDGKPYLIKGVGFNVDSLEFAEEEMKRAREMGFNSLRLWGQGQANIAGLDLAEKYGLSVVPSWWLSHDMKNKPQARDYSSEKENAAEIEAIVEWVQSLKDHPAVLMWGIGNEAYHFGGQGEPYCKHLENICKAIKAADPNHPIMTVDVNVSPIWDLAKHTPSLDIYGCNTYSGWVGIKSTAAEVAKIMKRPTVISEFGPGLPSGNFKINPKIHAQGWVDAWKKGILAARENCLGGYFFVFHDGRPDDTYFGLFDYKNRPKPVIAQAIRNALNSGGAADTVKVAAGAEGPLGPGFELQFNGEPYFIKGVNFRIEDVASKNFELVSQVGLNTVRLPYDAAAKPDFEFINGYGIKAVVRIDLEPEYRVKQPPAGQRPSKMEWEPSGRDYSNPEQNKAAIYDIVAKVDKLKGHPGLLLWEIGCETYSESTHREEFAGFLNEICKAVHAADPNHPVVYTTSFDAGIRDFAKFTPELDILGSVSYAGPGILTSCAADAKRKMNKPVVFMVSSFLDEGSGRSNLSEEVKTWMDVEMWKRGVLRSRPYALGGFFRSWQDRESKDFWGKDQKDLYGFVRKDGVLKDANVAAVREVLVETAD